MERKGEGHLLIGIKVISNLYIVDSFGHEKFTHLSRQVILYSPNLPVSSFYLLFYGNYTES